ncbi:MAG TPA: nodulation protein NfeD [Clostridia bacterium]|nr:nodulation protein NfeD [Clostridia bacterium]
MKQKGVILLVLIALLLTVLPVGGAWGRGETVYVVPIEGTIEKGLTEMLRNALQEAGDAGASLIVLQIDTPGGFVDAAQNIEKLIQNQEIPVVAYVTGGALSAGALIAFSADQLYMAPGTTIGAAEPRIGTEKADEKTVSAWSARLAAQAARAAEENGRDPERAAELARAMVESDLEIPGVVEKGKLLTLTDKQAYEWGLSDGIVSSLNDLLAQKGFEQPVMVSYQASLAERLARWATSPYVMPVLLMLGIGGLIVEVFTVGFGVPGTIGVAALILYFGGSYITGMSGWEAILLFLLGIILLAVEVLLLPGFGAAGIAGIGALVISIIMAAPSLEQAVMSLVLSLLGTVAFLVLSIKFLPTRRVWQKLVLAVKQQNESGYVAPEVSLQRLLGAEGVTLTVLRPAGTAEINGERVDVVAEGSYISSQTPIKVVKVEGTRVVVREKKEE